MWRYASLIARPDSSLTYTIRNQSGERQDQHAKHHHPPLTGHHERHGQYWRRAKAHDSSHRASRGEWRSMPHSAASPSAGGAGDGGGTAASSERVASYVPETRRRSLDPALPALQELAAMLRSPRCDTR